MAARDARGSSEERGRLAPEMILLVVGHVLMVDLAGMIRPVDQLFERLVGERSAECNSDLAFPEETLTNRDADPFCPVVRRDTLGSEPYWLPLHLWGNAT